MRGVSKPCPPQDVYPDGQAKASLSDVEAEYLAGLTDEPDKQAAARSKFDQLAKSKLRATLYREQRFLCIYCERGIDEGYPTDRIDHWRPLSAHPELALQWKNLYLSCSESRTCDSAKRDRPLRWGEGDPHLPWPVDRRYEDLVGFTSLGEIYVRSDVDLPPATRRALELAIANCRDGDRVRHSIVNLNHPALVAAREEVVHGERKWMKGRDQDQREGRATSLLDQDRRPQFVSIRIASLRGTLGRGQ